MDLSGVCRGLKPCSRLDMTIRTTVALEAVPSVRHGHRRAWTIGATASTAASTATAFSVEAAETMLQLCSSDQWPGIGRLPLRAAAACSILFPAIMDSCQHSSSNSSGAALVRGHQTGTAANPGEDEKLLSQLLTAVLGDLEATLATPQLSALLYQLPVSSVKILLSSDNLTTPSEDTIWYIVQQYIDNHLAQTAAKHQRHIWDIEPAYVAALHEDLNSLIRLPHVTDFCLSYIVATLNRVAVASGREDYDELLEHVSKFKECRELDGFVPRYQLQKMVEAGAPCTWLLPARSGV